MANTPPQLQINQERRYWWIHRMMRARKGAQGDADRSKSDTRAKGKRKRNRVRWDWKTIAMVVTGLVVLRLYGARTVAAVRERSSTFDRVAQMPSDVWEYILAHPRTSTRAGQLNLVIVALLVSEVPVYAFSVLDYFKLKSIDHYRIHYSKVEKRRPRLYPTNAELLRALRVSGGVFFGLYLPLFIVLITAANFLEIYPYSFAKELPEHWLFEIVLCLCCVPD